MKLKKLKKAICACAVAGLVGAVGVLPAFASPISSFPLQSRSNYTKSYTRMLQVMTSAYNTDCRNYINNAGGCDGVYGTGTYKAVRNYQALMSLSPDGICGSDTWSSLATLPVYTGTSGSYYTYRINGSGVLRKVRATENWECKVVNTWYYVG